jgi:hypothetical protein
LQHIETTSSFITYSQLAQRSNPMGAVKQAAIELEMHMEEAASISSTTIAYRLGMIEACRLITETSSYYSKAQPGAPAWEALHQAWLSVRDAVEYLREVDARS